MIDDKSVNEVWKQHDRDIQSSNTEIAISKDEIEMFERLMAMEEVHNLIGVQLGLFKDSIMETRNKYMKHLQRKYKMDNPALFTYDQLGKKIVSVLHPNLKASKIISTGDAFQTVASRRVMDLINELLLLRKTKKG